MLQIKYVVDGNHYAKEIVRVQKEFIAVCSEKVSFKKLGILRYLLCVMLFMFSIKLFEQTNIGSSVITYIIIVIILSLIAIHIAIGRITRKNFPKLVEHQDINPNLGERTVSIEDDYLQIISKFANYKIYWDMISTCCIESNFIVVLCGYSACFLIPFGGFEKPDMANIFFNEMENKIAKLNLTNASTAPANSRRA